MFDSIRQFWSETMQITEARWVVWLTVLLILVVTAIYVVKLFREYAFGGRPNPAERIEDLKRLKEIGALSDAEYQRAREADQSTSGLRDEATKLPEPSKSLEPVQFKAIGQKDSQS